MSVTNKDSKDELFSNIVPYTVPIHAMYCHNLDFSTFPFLCEMVHRHLIESVGLCHETMPFAVFQHYMTVLLNMHLINCNEYSAASLNVPGPIAEYLSNINTITLITGETIQVNIPKIAIPQFTVPNEENKAEIPPGSFGRLTAENHNVYECYVSPYITRQLVEQTRDQKFGPWNPLPSGAYPLGTMPNKNLLGYAEPEKLTQWSLQMLQKYKFCNTNNMMGRLQIEPTLMQDVNSALCTLRDFYTLKYFNTIQQNSTQNLVGVTKVSTFPYDECTHNVQISELVGDIFSPYSLQSTLLKKSMLCSLKRSRTTVVPGYCYTKPDGQAPDGWEHYINHNFNMKKPFDTTKYPDYSHLRDEYHIATIPKGDKIDLINDWIKSYNVR